MKPRSPTDAARAVTVEHDDGRHAARVVMLSTLFLFSLILLLQALAP
jgi:hypothetical protein